MMFLEFFVGETNSRLQTSIFFWGGMLLHRAGDVHPQKMFRHPNLQKVTRQVALWQEGCVTSRRDFQNHLNQESK